MSQSSSTATETSLTVSATKLDFRDCLALLKRLHPNLRMALNESSVLFELPLDNGKKSRVLLVGAGGFFQTVGFSMTIEPSGVKDPAWPKELPLIPGATPDGTIMLPRRGSGGGTFTVDMGPDRAKDEFAEAIALERVAASRPLA